MCLHFPMTSQEKQNWGYLAMLRCCWQLTLATTLVIALLLLLTRAYAEAREVFFFSKNWIPGLPNSTQVRRVTTAETQDLWVGMPCVVCWKPVDFQDAVAELSRVAEESLMSISTVRALGAEERETVFCLKKGTNKTWNFTWMVGNPWEALSSTEPWNLGSVDCDRSAVLSQLRPQLPHLFFVPSFLRNERILEVQKRNSLLLAAIVGIMLFFSKQLQIETKKTSQPLVRHGRFIMVTTWLPNFCEAMLWEASAWETPPSVATWKHPLDSPIPQKTMDAEQLDCQVLRPLSFNVFGLWWSISSKLSNFWRGSNTIPFLFGYGAARRGSCGIPLGFWEWNWVGMCVIAHM